MSKFQGECCDICGDIGYPEALTTCCQCKINVEHMYCMRVPLEKIVDDWRCEECKPHSKTKQASSSQLGDLTEVSRTNLPGVSNGGEPRTESRKMAPAGKTKYISVNEAIMLSAGEKKYFPSSTNTWHSRAARHRSGRGRLDRASFRPKTVPEASWPRKPQRPSDMETHVKQPQQSKNLRDEFRSVRNLRPSEAMKDTHKVIEQPSEVQLRRELVQQPPPPVPSGNASPAATSGTFTRGRKCHAVCNSKFSKAFPLLPRDEKRYDAIPTVPGGDGHNNAIYPSTSDGESMSNDLVLDSELPALDVLWKGSFWIEDSRIQAKRNHLVKAHPPLHVRKKVYEFSKQMPQVLHFKLVPSTIFRNNLFNGQIVDKRSVGLYFFPGVGERSEEEYINLVDSISSTNLALMIQIADVELWVFSSKLLSVDCQYLGGNYYLWGVFNRLKVVPITPSRRRAAELPLQPSDDVNYGKSHCEEADMEVDMIGGTPVGKIDVRVEKKPRKLEEPRPAVALLPEFAMEVAPVATGLPNVKMELDDMIPPGFEEVYRLKMQSSSSSADKVMKVEEGR